MGKKRKSRAPHYAHSKAARHHQAHSKAARPARINEHYDPIIPDADSDSNVGAATSSLPPLPSLDVPDFKLTSAPASGDENAMSLSPPPFRAAEEADEGEWELPGRNKKPKKEKVPKKKNYPEFAVSPNKLRREVHLSDLQGLVLWLQADAPAPQWLLVRHKPEIRRVVVLNVPGLTMGMFDGSLDLNPEDTDMEGSVKKKEENEDYFPLNLDRGKLPACVQDMADMFPHVWPVRAAGDDRYNRIHSPISTFLTSPLPKKTDIVDATPSAKKRLKVTQILMTLDELVENEYPLHSSQLQQLREELGQEETEEDRELLAKRTEEGWVETDLSKGNGQDNNEAGSILDGKTIYALDCEMVTTADGMELARISVIDWDGEVVYDSLVKPTNAITDYLTLYSGITAEMLKDVTTTLKDVQNHLLDLFNNDCILVGQSLNSDLIAMKLSHPHIIDTSVIYHHTRGPPYKASLKWLTQRFLKREIQKTGRASGHDSVEDARACLDLLKLKLEKGESFGTSDENRESIFKRLSRPPHGPRKTAIADYGDPQKYHGTYATAAITCLDDKEVVAAVNKCSIGDPSGIPQMDFTWARLRALETARGFVQDRPPNAVDIDGPLPEAIRDPPKEELIKCIQSTVQNIKEVYDGLPQCTAFIVYSGTGDPRKWRQMNELHRRFKEEYKVRKWDEIGVKWTDDEEQGLRRSLKVARRGVGFMVVK
jgi:RNA exonuclease 1